MNAATKVPISNPVFNRDPDLFMNIKSSLLVTFENVFVSKSCHINIIFIISCNAALLYIMLIHIVLFQNYVLLVSDCSLYAD